MTKGIKSTFMSVRLGLELATPKTRYNHSNHCATKAVFISYLGKIVTLKFWGLIFEVLVSHTQTVCVAYVIIVITSYSYIACRIDTIRSHQ